MIKKTHTTIWDNEPVERSIFQFFLWKQITFYLHMTINWRQLGLGIVAFFSPSNFSIRVPSNPRPVRPVHAPSCCEFICALVLPHFQKALPELVDNIKEAVFSRQNRAVPLMNTHDSDNTHKNDPILAQVILNPSLERKGWHEIPPLAKELLTT